MTEADTCRKFVVPLLQKAGWDNDPHSIAEQRYFTAGRIVGQSQTARHRSGKRADYVFRYTAEKVRNLCISLEDLRARWADTEQRAAIIEQLAERGVDFQTGAAQAGKPDADPLDLLCHLAFNAPILTRRQCADRVKRQQAAFFNYFAPEAREILSDLLEKYASDGEVQFTLPDILKVPPISQRGNVAEIATLFGGYEQLGAALIIFRLCSMLPKLPPAQLPSPNHPQRPRPAPQRPEPTADPAGHGDRDSKFCPILLITHHEAHPTNSFPDHSGNSQSNGTS